MPRVASVGRPSAALALSPAAWRRLPLAHRGLKSAERGLQPLHVHEILGTARCPLVLQQVVQADEGDLHVPDAREDALRLGIVELNAVDGRQDVDAMRLDSDLREHVRVQQVDQVLNARGVELGQHVAEVGIQHRTLVE